MKCSIRISEIFGPTIQGEGPLIGRPTVFVRTGGCDYRCRWCDTLYAVLPEYRDEWKLMTAAEILARVEDLAGTVPVLVSLSGGNPALQPLAPLIEFGPARGTRSPWKPKAVCPSLGLPRSNGSCSARSRLLRGW